MGTAPDFKASMQLGGDATVVCSHRLQPGQQQQHGYCLSYSAESPAFSRGQAGTATDAVEKEVAGSIWQPGHASKCPVCYSCTFSTN
jgi:hypothetical protein